MKKLVDVATLQRGFDLPTQDRVSGGGLTHMVASATPEDGNAQRQIELPPTPIPRPRAGLPIGSLRSISQWALFLLFHVNRLLEICDAHAHDLSLLLARLVKQGLLESDGRSRGTVYFLPGESLPTPEQVFVGPAFSLAASSNVGSSSERTEVTLRDTLLPRLINGQLRLPEIRERCHSNALL